MGWGYVDVEYIAMRFINALCPSLCLAPDGFVLFLSVRRTWLADEDLLLTRSRQHSSITFRR